MRKPTKLICFISNFSPKITLLTHRYEVYLIFYHVFLYLPNKTLEIDKFNFTSGLPLDNHDCSSFGTAIEEELQEICSSLTCQCKENSITLGTRTIVSTKLNDMLNKV